MRQESVIESHLLHLIARVAVRTQRPMRAKWLVDALARLLPDLTTAQAMGLAEALEGHGTCLTRALTVAARLPRAEVVIGTDAPSRRPFAAHAWVEKDGAVVVGTPPSRHVIARLR